MNKHTQLPVTTSIPHRDLPTATEAKLSAPHPVASAMFGADLFAYDWRTESCSACDEDSRCEYCMGSGEVDAACVECNRIVPLDSEGECLKCRDSAILPFDVFAAKYHPRVYVERIAPGRIGA